MFANRKTSVAWIYPVAAGSAIGHATYTSVDGGYSGADVAIRSAVTVGVGLVLGSIVVVVAAWLKNS